MPLSIGGHHFDDDSRVEKAYRKDRYASDALGRCANAQLDLLRLELLQRHGGMVLDHDVFVLRSLASWRRCDTEAPAAGSDSAEGRPTSVSSTIARPVSIVKPHTTRLVFVDCDSSRSLPRWRLARGIGEEISRRGHRAGNTQ